MGNMTMRYEEPLFCYPNKIDSCLDQGYHTLECRRGGSSSSAFLPGAHSSNRKGLRPQCLPEEHSNPMTVSLRSWPSAPAGPEES